MVNMPLQSRGNKNDRGFRQDPRSKRRALRQVLLSGMIEPIAAGRHAWEFDGAALVMDKGSDTEMTLTYDPEAVSFCAEQDGIEFLFTREMPVAFEAAPVRADAAIEEFAGAWTCTLIDAMGIQAPPEMMDMYAGVTIEGSSVTLAIPDLLSSEEVTVECTFADGALTAIVPSESEYIDDMAFTIQLLEDGSMSIATSFLDEPMVFYMTAEAIQE